MGRLSDYLKSILGFPQEPLRPNDIPRNIHEDFSHEFGNKFPQQPGPNWSSPDVEWHIFQEQVPDDHDNHDVPGGDMFREMEQLFESFFQGFPSISSPEFFNGPKVGIEQPPMIGDGSEQQQNQPINPDEPGCLRDKMLKQPDSDIQDHYGYSEQDQPSEFHSPHSWFGGLWKSPFDTLHQPQEKVDKDLDSELESGQQSLDDILSHKQESDRSLMPTMPRSSSQSYSSITTIDSHGNRESKTTRRDSNGREEVTITRKSGNKEHTIKTWKNENGTEETQENIVNIEPGMTSPQDRTPMSSIYESIIDQFFPRR